MTRGVFLQAITGALVSYGALPVGNHDLPELSEIVMHNPVYDLRETGLDRGTGRLNVVVTVTSVPVTMTFEDGKQITISLPPSSSIDEIRAAVMQARAS